MAVRWVVVIACVWTSAVFADVSKMPGNWLEAERTADLPSEPKAGVLAASGGATIRLRGSADGIRLPLVLDKPVQKPRVFIRYHPSEPNPVPMRLAIGAENAKPEEFKPLLDFDLARPASGPLIFRWAVVQVESLPAGKHQLQLTIRDRPVIFIEVDVIGIVNAETHPLWLPPEQVKDGRFLDAGRDGPAVQVQSVATDSPLQLVYGDELLGDRGRPLLLKVSLANVTSQPASVTLTAVMTGEGGSGARQGAPPMKLEFKPDERRTLDLPVRPPGYGWFQVQVISGEGDRTSSAGFALGVLRRPVKGIRPQSMFGLNVSHHDVDMQAAQMMGVKWRRGVPARFDPSDVAPAPGQWMDEKVVNAARAAVRKWKDAEILTLGLVNYNTPWNTAPDANGKPLASFQNRPRDLALQAEIEYRMFKALRADVTYWEIWNEPWEYGWTWQTGTAQDYRDLSRLIWEKVKPEMPEIMLIGGGSTSYQRDVLFAPGNKDIGYADGCSTHPYSSPDRTMPSSAAVESVLLKKYSKSGGPAGIWATEVGAPTYSFETEPEAMRPFTMAKCIAPLYLLNRIGAGDTPIRVFYFTANHGEPAEAFNLWNGGDPQPGIVAYNAMTHFLEDGKYVEDLMSASTSMWAPMFTKPDGTNVVAFWAEDGFSGRMILPEGMFEAFDYLGAPLGREISFGRWQTTYLVSRQSPDQVRAAMAAIRFEGMDSLRINPRSFTQPLEKLPPLRLKVQNLLPRKVDAKLAVTVPPELELAGGEQTIKDLAPGEIRFVEFPLKRATPTALNRYRIDYTAVVGDQRQQGTQVIQAAYARFGSATVDGSLDEWKDQTPVTALSRGGKDLLQAALNPDKAAAILSAKTPGDTVAYRVWTRWDEQHFYLAAEVPDNGVNVKPPFAKSPSVFAFEVDNLQMAFDCLEPNPDDWFVNHPLREKCLGSEVDYEFSIAAAGEGGKLSAGELHRLKAPGTNYQTFYASNVPLNPPLGLMKEGTAAITYDAAAKVLRYEVAIPWTAIRELGDRVRQLKPGEIHQTRFAFGVIDSGGDARGKTFWTREAGDLQSGAYGFTPTWTGGSTRHGGRILTDWGFVR